MADPPNTLAISEFKATCLKVLDQVKLTGTPVLVTRRGQPVAMVVPPPPAEAPPRWLGSFAGTAHIAGDIVSPAMGTEEWEVLRP